MVERVHGLGPTNSRDRLHFFPALEKVTAIVFLQCLRPEKVVAVAIRVFPEVIEHAASDIARDFDVGQVPKVLFDWIDHVGDAWLRAAVSVATPRGLRDRIDAGQEPNRGPKVDIHTGFNELSADA